MSQKHHNSCSKHLLCINVVLRWRAQRRKLEFNKFKGTQDWDFFWLRFWNLYYFFVSYVKILRFYKKKILIGPFWGEVRFFRVVLGLRGIKIVFNLGPKKFFFSTSYMTPLYLLKKVFPKFDPLTASGMAFSVNLGPKYQNLFPLVWD